MDLVDQTNVCIKVRVEELESKIRSKRDLYYVLRQWCKKKLINFKGQYYLPDESHWSIRFLKDILSGKEKAWISKYLQRHSNQRILRH